MMIAQRRKALPSRNCSKESRTVQSAEAVALEMTAKNQDDSLHQSSVQLDHIKLIMFFYINKISKGIFLLIKDNLVLFG